LAGAIFVYFSNGRYSFALAAWLFPVFLLQVSRKEKAIYAYLYIPLLAAVCTQLAFWRFTYQDASSVLFYLPFILGLPMGLIFFIDRVLYSKTSGFAATFIFPLIYTSLDFSLNLFNPFGTLGVLGYSQFGFLSFSQLASVTGMWGLTFMITWFGSVVYWLIQNYTNRKAVVKGVSIYFTILFAVIIYGVIRLNLPLSDDTVKIAGIHCHDKRIEGAKMNELLDNKDTVAFKTISDTIIQHLIRETIKQSNAGARIVLWSEISSKILKRDEDSLVAVFKQLAKQQKIYLLTTPYVVTAAAEGKPENKILFFSPDGKLVLTHYKYGGNFMEGTVQGNKEIKTVTTEYGNLSAIICWDADFPSIVKQVGKSGTSILFVPASDWEEIDRAHSIVTIFRGIENGCPVVRQTRNGLSVMTDPAGRVIAQMDHFKNNSWVTVGQVPTKKLFTVYPVIGDLFGWLSLIGLLFFIILQKRKK
jgi:apolipoprotein N-acyltransferase